jgi:hypothetical protein
MAVASIRPTGMIQTLHFETGGPPPGAEYREPNVERFVLPHMSALQVVLSLVLRLFFLIYLSLT